MPDPAELNPAEGKKEVIMLPEGPARPVPPGTALDAWVMTFRAPEGANTPWPRTRIDARIYTAAAWAAAPESQDKDWQAQPMGDGRVLALRLTPEPDEPAE